MLDKIIFNNSIKEWLIAVVVFAVVVFALKFFRSYVITRIKKISSKTKTELDDMVIDAIKAIHWPFYVLSSFYISLHFVYVPEFIQRWTFYIFLAVTIYYVIKFFESLVDYTAEMIISRKEEEDRNTGIVKLITILMKIGLWIGAVVLILSNMGYNITSLIAGLGIGGIAIALALQNILADLFSSLAIYLDKPFKVGDTIVVGDQIGTVERIGIKTTRIKVLQGEELVISNQELSTSKIRNFGVMEKRRVVLNIGVTYDTPSSKLKMIPEILKGIIDSKEDVDIDRVHFKSFGDSSLMFEAVFYLNNGEYQIYMDTQQEINLEIVDAFEKEKIEMAFPTQTIYIKK